MLRTGGTDLARRWVAALMLAPESDRPAIVAEVERRLVTIYAEPLVQHADAEPADLSEDAEAESLAPVVHVVSPPFERAGYVEQVERAYSAEAPGKAKARKRTPGDARSA